MFSKIPANRRGRDFFVGDLHGQLKMLEAMLEHVRFDPECDRLIAVGDVIDRGPSSVELLQMLSDHAWFLSCRGNHEELLRQTARGVTAARDEWSPAENRWFRGLKKAEKSRLASIVSGMPMALEVELSDGRRVGVIHGEVARSEWAGVAVARRWAGSTRVYHETTVAIALWGRRRARASFTLDVMGDRLRLSPMSRRLLVWRQRTPVSGIGLVISGHTISPQARPVLASNQLFIDTGAYMQKGRLTLFEPLHNRCWQMTNPETNPNRIVEECASPVPLDFEICAMSAEEQREAEHYQDRLDPYVRELLDLDP